MRALYISHNGMLEGLGRSQVLPYLRGLARGGVGVELLSFEMPEASDDEIAQLRGDLSGDGIRWNPLRRARDPRLVVKLRESAFGVGAALGRALARKPDIVHGRGYIPTAIADLVASTVPRAKLLFDCRGMLGDEYVDSGYWTPDRLEYRLVKRYETRAFRRAEGVVFLTDALRRWATERGWLGARTSVETIPCCVDLAAFRPDLDARASLRDTWGIADAFVLVYAGSLGSWYEEDEMARFAGIVRARAEGRRVHFLLLTRSDPKAFAALLRGQGFDETAVTVVRAKPGEMPQYLTAGDVGLSFIKSCFSKKGSSPTKVAEYLACGLSVVLNGDIGDQKDLAVERDACVVLDSYEHGELARAADRALALGRRSMDERVRTGRRVADERFGLERVGVPRYERLYRRLASGIDDSRGSPRPAGPAEPLENRGTAG